LARELRAVVHAEWGPSRGNGILWFLLTEGGTQDG
jgi:hypothetical protein